MSHDGLGDFLWCTGSRENRTGKEGCGGSKEGVMSQHVDIVLSKLFSFCSMADIIHTTLL